MPAPAIQKSASNQDSSSSDKKDVHDSHTARPDKKIYDAEQTRIKSEIDALQAKLSAVREKFSPASKGGPANDRKTALRAELDSLRDQQASGKNSRGKLHDQIEALNTGIQKKIKDLQAAKSKIPFKNIAELDAHIKNLEKQVESGNMKLADEKRALQEISSTKRNRRVVEGFQAEQAAIDADRAKVDELKKQLDDPASKALSERYTAIKNELDEMKKESDVAYAGRSKLIEERENIQNQLKALFDEKRESAQNFRDANDKYWNKVNEDRARRAEKYRLQRAADEAAKKREVAERLLEEAQIPAFQAQIEDCQTLVDYFSGKTTGAVTLKSASTPLSVRAEVAGVPKLELRKVEEVAEGMVALKKKGEDEESYFVGKSKAKGKKAPKTNGSSTVESPSANLNVPLPTLSALLTLSIPPPASNADVPRVIEDLKTKKAWFEANQARQTTENISKAQAEIARLNANDVPPNGNGEIPSEPTSTPATGVTADPVPSEAVVDKLESVKEDETKE